jgi:hypothetical protein
MKWLLALNIMYPVQYPWITNYGPRDKKEPNASTENKL